MDARGAWFVATNGSWPELGPCLQTIQHKHPAAKHYACSLPMEIAPSADHWTNTPTIWMWNAARQWNQMLRSSLDPAKTERSAFLWLRHGATPTTVDDLLNQAPDDTDGIAVYESQVGLLVVAAAGSLAKLRPPATGQGWFDESVGNTYIGLELLERARSADVPISGVVAEPTAFGENGGLLLSACLIVRDGQPFIAQCLESLVGVADEVVIVLDTATTDATASIAQRYGAFVFPREWTGDFAAAKNAALAKATGKWTLCLDADEVLAPQGGHLLRATLQQIRPAYVRFPLFNYAVETGPGGSKAYVVRLAPRDPKIAFVGKIHEQLQGLALPQQTIEQATLYHYGYLGAMEGTKIARNEAYVTASWRANPTDPRMAWYKAGTHAWKGELQEALAVLQQVPSGTAPIDHLRAQVLAALGRSEEALLVLERLHQHAKLPPAHVTHGEVLLALGRYEEAAHVFQRGLTAPWDPKLREQTPMSDQDLHAQCYTGLGNVALSQGNVAGAQERFWQALQTNAACTTAHLALAELHLVEGQWQSALQHLAEARPRANAIAMQKIALLTSQAHVTLGQPELAQAALQQAPMVMSSPDGIFWSARIAELTEDWARAVDLWTKLSPDREAVLPLAHRAACLLRMGDLAGAQADLEVVLQDGQIRHPYALVAMALLAQTTGNPTEALSYLYQAYDLGVTDVDCLLLISQIALQTGDKKNARQAVQAVLQANPDHPVARLLREHT